MNRTWLTDTNTKTIPSICSGIEKNKRSWVYDTPTRSGKSDNGQRHVVAGERNNVAETRSICWIHIRIIISRPRPTHKTKWIFPANLWPLLFSLKLRGGRVAGLGRLGLKVAVGALEEGSLATVGTEKIGSNEHRKRHLHFNAHSFFWLLAFGFFFSFLKFLYILRSYLFFIIFFPLFKG